MAISESYQEYVVDQLRVLGRVTVKKMFGGAGVYYDSLIFGLLADDVLYFKVDDSNRSDYERAGMEPFQPFAEKPMVMPYYEVPVDILENIELLAEWAKKALIASRNKYTKPKKQRIGKSGQCFK
ncbi:TfoX/Sxy family protein [Desulfosporosinus nitroreducens]|uniref:TfoX/Sxy family protein n=1 Tax=Desulfosporosinus nitroreducens TaxID=2018668 RepID=A0ABT8QS18_9FIRM|nr:TfoX/Sxy family protein [Desulfosporosinus nitroreducens]MCO1602525.1 TfoX/Sxy family protein [Desulfosporosinus nitroreducens]MDO0824142.1 TfoX/Sxy family protein [Desulfosporosinus nitroreducens]